MADRAKPFAVRFEGGADLPDAIVGASEQLGLSFCDVHAFGTLEAVEIQAAGAEGTRQLQGPLDLLDLNGRLRRAGGVVLADYFCTLSRATDSGIELLGGRLVAGRASFLEVTLFGLEAVEVESRPDDPAEAAPPPEPKAPVVGRWAEALAESKRQERRARERGWDWDSDEEEVRPSRGDIVVHRQFGRCQVVRLDDEHISLRKPDGRVVQLGLAVLAFTPAGTQDGAEVYDVTVNKA
jgi:predicted DNA-binding protein with PD1-like motif